MADVISTLENGWHSDNHPVDQPKGSYRDMLNSNLITKNGDHFSAETQQGTIVSFSIPDYFASPVSLQRFTPIGFFSFVDKLVVMATNDESATGATGMIGVVTIGENGIGTWDTLYYSNDLLFTKQNRLDGYALNETTNINRVYWCDNLNNPRVVNISSTSFDVVPTGSLVIGQQYMVVEGTINETASGNNYGPGQILGYLFTATGINYTGTGKLINYVSVNSITIQPPVTVGEIDYVETTRDGSLYAGMKAYTYRLKSSNGKITTFGPISKPIHVSPNTPVASITGYQAYEGAGISSVLVRTNAAINLLISDLPFNDFQFIEVVAIEYDQTIEVIRAITKVVEDSITSSTIAIKHFGTENLGTLTIDDLTAIETIVISAKAMNTFKMRGFMANLKERAEFTDDVTADVVPFIYSIPADTTGGIGPKNYTYEGTTNPVLLNIAADGKYKVKGTGSITYNGVPYVVGDVFIGVANVIAWVVVSGAPSIVAIIRIRKYKAFNGGADVFKDIEIKDEYLDYKGEAVHHYLTGYWRDETYRIGFLGFDKYRQPFFVRWLGDPAIPSQSAVMGNGTGGGVNGAPNTGVGSFGDGGLMNVYAGTAVPPNTVDNLAQTSINIMGIQIDNLVLTPDIVDRLDSFAIVRCPRDKQILTQGLMFTTTQSSVNTFQPLATYDNSVDANAFANAGNGQDGSWPDMYTLKSPEIQFSQLVPALATELVLQSGDILKPVARYTALNPYSVVGATTDPSGTGIYPIYDITNATKQFFSKWYYHSKYTGGTAPIIRYTFVEANATITAFDGSSDFNNTLSLISSVAAPVHPLVPVAAFSSATGGKCGLFWVDDNASQSFLNTSAPGNPKAWTSGANQKLLTNWVRPKTGLYGGRSEASLALSEYIYCGHIQKIDAAFLSDNYDAGTDTYKVSGIQVFGGDCLVNIYDNVSQMYRDNLGASYDYGVYFPCEMTLDSVMRQGDHFAKGGLHLTPVTGIAFDYSGYVNYEDYNVNSAYSTTDELDFKYPALPLGFSGDGIFPARVRYSNVKTIGETIDSQRIYLPNNYRDVDTNHGEINNLKIGTNRLFYWQNKGVGYLPVDEREIINGSLGSAVQLGVGSVAQRFDNMDIYFGNQHQWSLVETPDRFYWFDMRRKALCYLNFGGQTVEFSTVNGQQSFFNNRFTAIESIASPNIFDSDQPIMGRGISGWYDSRFETTYMTFKLTPIISESKYNFTDFTVSISHQLNKFIGQHSFVPGIAHEYNGHSLSVATKVVGLLIFTPYVAGDLVTFQGITYICLTAMTTGFFIANQPDILYPGFWGAINQIDDIAVHWRGDTAKFYGRVYDNYIDIVINGQGESVSFDNYEAYGNEFNYTDIIVNSEKLTGQDLNILPENRNYRFYDGSWKASYPLSTTNSRFNDKYIIVKFKKQNQSGSNYTTSLNEVKRLLFLKSVIRKKQ